jgi:hypothetical protein
MSRAIVTAVIVPGRITQRVDRVIRPRREAVELLKRADAIAAARPELRAVYKSYPRSPRHSPPRSTPSPARSVPAVAANTLPAVARRRSRQ